MKDPIEGVSIGVDETNIFNWNIIILGPKDSPYEGGVFKAEMIQKLYHFSAIFNIISINLFKILGKSPII